jgi:transposase
MPATERVRVVDIDQAEVEQLLESVKGSLEEPGYEKLSAMVHGYIRVLELLQAKGTTIKRLRKLCFGSGSEKLGEIFPEQGRQADTDDGSAERWGGSGEQPEKKKRKGHGRHGAFDYPGARRTWVPHATLKPGDGCPLCARGKLYEQKRPGVIVRFKGRAPVSADLWELERLRCNLCGEVFTAEAPEQARGDKYDESVAAMIAMLRYGAGTPFYRLARLQQSLGVPLADSTQWDIVHSHKPAVKAVFDQMVKQAADGKLFHNDDTTMKVLELMGKTGKPLQADERDEQEDADGSQKRKGIFTSGIVSVSGGHQIALYFTGHRHAGENLRQVLLQRTKGLGPAMQMCDGLSRNEPKNLPEALKTIIGNCTAHARRRFVEVADNFPDECLHVLEELAEVYHNDDIARRLRMTDEHRLRFHQLESGPVMVRLKKWMRAELKEKRVEPNSGLGAAIEYTLKHWRKLVLFLRVPGAPLDNNIVERSLKKLILLRKNSLFYKTENGARVGDMYMSLIHTAELCRANVFEYLVALMRNADRVVNSPGEWMPWSYTTALAGLSSGVDPPQ